MKFFHVYNKDSFVGLEKNGLINKDTGFKIQHAFSVPLERTFNNYAAKGTPLYNMIKDGKIPFYVDRIAGGITFYEYNFDKALIREYIDILGDWFLGFQLHESASNRTGDWRKLMKITDGRKGPYDAKELRKKSISPHAVTPLGIRLPDLTTDSPEAFAPLTYAKTPEQYIEEVRDMFIRRMNEVEGRILPCDSFYMFTKMQNELGMHTFMPEVGCQIPNMREQVALARGIAKANNKTWGTYYECWREMREDGQWYYSMPCFNNDSSNEWYLTQELHPDDFTTYGENGGSSRLLQNRIYYYSLMAGSHYFSEEWGLNCSYSDMKEFTLSDYGKVKKDFIDQALTLQGIKAKTPFAIILPENYECMQVETPYTVLKLGQHRDTYMYIPMSKERTEYIGHIEDVLKLFYERINPVGNEGHVITNSRIPDVCDIIYADASDEVLSQYEYLIDATPDQTFIKAKAQSSFKILDSSDLSKLESTMKELIKETMPCYVDDLCWLVSTDENGKNYLSIFNNEGNERSFDKGNTVDKSADKKVKITFKETANIEIVKEALGKINLEKVDDKTYFATIPAAGFAILTF